MKAYMVLAAALYLHSVLAVSISDITSGKYDDQDVRDVPGVVTATFPDDWFSRISVRSTTPELSRNSSNSVFIWGDTIAGNFTVGDSIVFDAKITWFSDGALDSVRNIRRIATNVSVEPVLVGPGGLIPVSDNSSASGSGIDFWRTLNAELVAIPNATFLDYSKSQIYMGEVTSILVRGDWPSRGVNNRGGLTMVNEGET
jgi:hypothetical protein